MTKEEIEQNAAAYIAEQTKQPWQWRYPNCPWTDAKPGGNPVHYHIAIGNRCRQTPSKPDPTVIPWTLKTRPMGAVMVIHKQTRQEYVVLAWLLTAVIIGSLNISYERLFADYTLQDGSPCGQLIQP